MIIGTHHKYVFVSTPKAATHALNRVLFRQYGGEFYIRMLTGQTTGPMHPFHFNMVPEQYMGWTIFTAVRNPFARAVSLWWHIKTTEPAKSIFHEMLGGDDFGLFAQYLRSFPRGPLTHWWDCCIPQAAWLHVNDQRYARVLRVETLEKDFAKLPFAKTSVHIPMANSRVASRKPWWTYYDNYSQNAIRAWADEDFSSFGYPDTIDRCIKKERA